MPSGYTLDFSQIQMTGLPHSCSSCPSSLMTRLSRIVVSPQKS